MVIKPYLHLRFFMKNNNNLASVRKKKDNCRDVSCGTMEFNWGSGFRGIQKIAFLLHVIKDDLVFA